MAKTQGRKGAREPQKLPTTQLVILAICRLAEPVALASALPYLPEMIESFGMKKDVAKWAGITTAVFYIAQSSTAFLWGRASDKFGRRPMIILGLITTVLSSVLWGMSTSLPMAMISRAISGGCNGIVGILRTMVAEIVPERNLQLRVFSLLPLMFTLGCIFGASLGGLLAKPAENFPWLFGHNSFLIGFPFVLPNLVLSVFILIILPLVIMFLNETLAAKRHRIDWGLLLGVKIKALFQKKKSKHVRLQSILNGQSTTYPLNPISTRSLSLASSSSTSQDKPSISLPIVSETFTTQSIIIIIAYTFLSLHELAFEALLPIFVHNPGISHDTSNTRLPFKFAGGFGLTSGRIGFIWALYGIFAFFIRVFVFTPVAHHYGVLNCFKACALTYPVIWLVTPYAALIDSSVWQQVAIIGILALKSCADVFAFPCCMILLTNSAVSLRNLGTLNGTALSVSGIGRALGPAIAGVTFTWGVERGYVIMPWWIIAFISAIGAIPIWWLVETDGLSTESERSSPSSEDEEDGLLSEDPEAGYELDEEEQYKDGGFGNGKRSH